MNNASGIPLFFPRYNTVPESGLKILGADVGGTKTNLAFFNVTRSAIQISKSATYRSAQFRSFNAIVKQFLDDNGLPVPDRICAGVAGPIVHGKVSITNLSEEMDAEEIRDFTHAEEVTLLNDLETTAYGLAALQPNELITLHEGKIAVKGNMAIIAPGTGLGEGGLFWDGEWYHPFPTEGGHCDFCPRSSIDRELYDFLHDKYGIVSWERLVAGPGIHDIYLYLRSVRNIPEPSWITNEFLTMDPSAVVSSAALAEKDTVCIEAMDLFVRYLARESSNLVLKMRATGGLFLGGGIPPKVISLLQKQMFMDNYFDCDRMKDILEICPVKVITNETTSLLGAGYYGAYGNAL